MPRGKDPGFDRMLRNELGQFVAAMRKHNPWLNAAENVKGMIQVRTRHRGIDRHGNPFTPYAEATVIKKRKQGKQTHPPNLTDKDLMLRRLTVRQIPGAGTREHVQVTFGDRRDERVARRHLEPNSHTPVRDFWGLTPEEEQRMYDDFGKDLDRILPDDKRRRVTINLT